MMIIDAVFVGKRVLSRSCGDAFDAKTLILPSKRPTIFGINRFFDSKLLF